MQGVLFDLFETLVTESRAAVPRASSLFDAMVFSFAVGLAKPDPEMYRLACQQLRVSPDHALFVGNGGDDELAGTRAAGLKARRALWFLTRRPHAAVPDDDPGLRQAGDLVDAVIT